MDKIKITEEHIRTFNQVFGNTVFQNVTECARKEYEEYKEYIEEQTIRHALQTVVKENSDIFKTEVTFLDEIHDEAPVRIKFRVMVLNPNDFQEKLLKLLEIWKRL